MSDRSFTFFTNIYNDAIKNKPKDSVTGAVQTDINVDYQINTYDATDPYKVVKSEQKTASYAVTQSILNEDQFINYKGNSKTNSFLPYNGTPDNNENLSLSDIIQWTQQNYPSMKLSYGNFAFLDNFGIYPANRLMILRRYSTGVPDDLFSHTSKPLYTMASYFDLDNSPLDISFNEVWTTFSDTFLSVLEDVIGIHLEEGDGIAGKALNMAKSNPLAQDILQKVASSLGVQTGPDNIYGDPNLIYEAKIRAADADGMKSGLEADISIKYEAKYVQREIGGVDAEAAFMMIIAEAVNMGTSNSRHLITKGATATLNSFIDSLKAGNVGDLFDKIVTSMSDILNKAVEKLETLASNTADAFKEGGISGAAGAIGGAILNEVKDLIRARYQRYRWKLIGAVGAMSGIPTAPWHISLGNPKNPWFVCGNLYIDSCTLEFGGELGYNDSPTELTVKYTLKNGRALGADEITSLFNSGKGRIYDTIDKLQTINVPEGSSSIKLPGNESNSNGINQAETGATALDNSEAVDTTQTNDLASSGAPTSDFANGTQEEDKNVPAADATSSKGFTYTLNSQGPNKWYVVRHNGKEVYTGRKSFSLTESELLAEAKAAVSDDGNDDN